MKARLLWNGYQRICCVILLVVLPMHFKQVLIPFDCIPPTAGDGPDTVRLAPSVECSFNNRAFYIMYHTALVLFFNIIVLFFTIVRMIS